MNSSQPPAARFSLLEAAGMASGLALGLAAIYPLFRAAQPGRWAPATSAVASAFLAVAVAFIAGAIICALKGGGQRFHVYLALLLVAAAIGAMVPFETYPTHDRGALLWLRLFWWLVCWVWFLAAVTIWVSLERARREGHYRKKLADWNRRERVLSWLPAIACGLMVAVIVVLAVEMRGERGNNLVAPLAIAACGVVCDLARRILKRGWHASALVCGAAIFLVLFAGGATAVLGFPFLRTRGPHGPNIRAILWTINSAEQQYKTGEIGSRYGSLATLSATGGSYTYLDSAVGSGTSRGYTFVLTLGPGGQSYSCRAATSDPHRDPWWFGRREPTYWTSQAAGIRTSWEGDPGVDENSTPLD